MRPGATKYVRAEWTKLRTLPSTGWLLLAVVASTVAVTALATGSLEYDRCRPPCVEDTTRFGVYGVRLGQVAVVVLAVLSVSNEYATRMVHVTLTALPRRLLMLTGKVATVAALVLVAGAAAVGGSLLIAGKLLSANGFVPSHGYPALSLGDEVTLRAAVGSVLYLGLIAVLSAGVALIVRDTAGAVTGVLALLFVAPIGAMLISDPRWQHRLHKYTPMDAGLAVQATRRLTHTDIGPWQGLGVLAAYAGAALLIGALLLWRRDA